MQFQNLKKEAKLLGLTTQTLGDQIKTKFQEYSAYFSVAEVFMYAEQGLRSMFEQVKLIDSAMTPNEVPANLGKIIGNT